jgi:ribosomal protein S18 acetylase RimI-like enzyme
MNMDANRAIEIRLAMIKEIDAIAFVLRQAFIAYELYYPPAAFAATTPTSDQIRERWEEGPVWVAVQNEIVVGTMAAVPKASGLYVRSMAVLPASRGQGIGRMLLQIAEDFAMHHHHSRIFLSTTPYLKQAIRLYEQFGFQIINEGPHDLFALPLFTMAKQLNQEMSLNENSIH